MQLGLLSIKQVLNQDLIYKNLNKCHLFHIPWNEIQEIFEYSKDV